MRLLTDDELKLLNQMQDTINRKSKRNALRSRYADSKKTLDQIGISVPPQMAGFATVLGWPDKTCSVLSRRLRPNGFALPVKSSLMDEIGEQFGSADVAAAERLAIDSAVRYGASFIFTSKGNEIQGEPEVLLTVRSSLSATAIRDPRSRRVIAALERVTGGLNLYLPGETLYCVRKDSRWVIAGEFETTPGRVLCVPYVHGVTLERPFGKSRITRPVMGLTDIAARVMLRQEVSAEFFSAPQRYMLGATEEMFVGKDGQPRTGWEAILGSLLAAPDVEDDLGERKRVEVGQFPQMSMQPHSDHLRSVAMMFSGETGIPVGYLGVIQDNPSSADAIHAAEAELVSIAESETMNLSAARVDLARNVIAVLHGDFTATMAKELRALSSLWLSPATPTQAATADATMKRVTALPWLAESDVVLRDMGYDASTIEQLKADRARARVNTLVSNLGTKVASAESDPAVAAAAATNSEPTATVQGGAVDASDLKARFDALGVAVRAGVDPQDAARRLGLDGIAFTGAVPVSLRMPTEDATGLEGK